MVTKLFKAHQQLEQFILHQRKMNIIISTNSQKMKKLMEKAHTNIIVELMPNTK